VAMSLRTPPLAASLVAVAAWRCAVAAGTVDIGACDGAAGAGMGLYQYQAAALKRPRSRAAPSGAGVAATALAGAPDLSAEPINLMSLPMAGLVLPELFSTSKSPAASIAAGASKAAPSVKDHDITDGASMLQVSVGRPGQQISMLSSNMTQEVSAASAVGDSASASAALTSAASTAQGAASQVLAGVRADNVDMSWLLVGMVILGICYTITGMCTHIEVRHPGEETLAEGYAQAVAAHWPRSTPGFMHNSLPAICGKMLGHTGDVPLLVPVGPLEVDNILEYRAAFKVDVMSRSSRKPVFTVSLATDDVGRPFLLEVRSRGDVVASLDATGTLFGPDNTAFGRMIKLDSGEYYLEEANSLRDRWLVSLREGGRKNLRNVALSVTWRPKGQLLATAIRGPKPDGSDSEFLQVTNSPGVDMVLVLITTLGVLAFDTIPRIAEGQRTIAGVIRGVESEVKGMAKKAMDSLHIPSSRSHR